MVDTMRAVVLESAPAPPEGLKIKKIPIPKAEKGKVLIKVKAYGLNRSELHTRIGLAIGVSFPRVLGIEACGVVAKCPGGEFQEGQQVCAMMGGMGRVFDGGYAEYTLVPVANVHAFHSKTLSWSTLGAIPEMLQTAYGSLTIGCDGQKGQSILIRGGTSSIGMATAVLAKQRGMTVFSTTRSERKSQTLKEKVGVDHVIIDDGQDVASKVRAIAPRGVDCALELVGADTLKDTLKAVKVKGMVCFTGMLSNSWIIKDFYPMDYIPNGVRLTAYGGGAEDLPGDVLQAFINAVEAGKAYVPIDKVFKMDQISEAHAYMESGQAAGKLVVETGM